jgi:hypothetical protein
VFSIWQEKATQRTGLSVAIRETFLSDDCLKAFISFGDPQKSIPPPPHQKLSTCLSTHTNQSDCSPQIMVPWKNVECARGERTLGHQMEFGLIGGGGGGIPIISISFSDHIAS